MYSIKKTNILLPFISLVVLTLAATACAPAVPTQLVADFISTQVEATINSRATSDMQETIEARMTQQARPTSTPTPPPSPTSTQAATTQGTGNVVPTVNLQPTVIYVPPQPVVTSTPKSLCLQATFVGDITIPDGTVIEAGKTFTKTWEFKNSGTCSWNTQFDIFFVSGDQLSAPAVLDFPGNVPPGDVIRISIDMKAPTGVGTYTGYWNFANPDGVRFGIGLDGKGNFSVQIVVK